MSRSPHTQRLSRVLTVALGALAMFAFGAPATFAHGPKPDDTLGQPLRVLDAVFARFQVPNVLCDDLASGSATCADLSANAGVDGQSTEVALGDLNNDGIDDAVFSNAFGEAEICLGDASGGFACSDHDIGRGEYYSVDLGFVDGDRNLDAVFGNLNSFLGSKICLGDGLGGFASCAALPSGTPDLHVALGHIDDDPYLDVVIGTGYSGGNQPNQVCFGDGLGGFACSNIEPAGLYSGSVKLGDLNGDHHLDAVFATGSFIGNSPDRVCFGDGLGGFSCGNIDGTATTSFGVDLGDVDGDFDLDVVFSGIAGSPHRVCLGDGLGGFTCSTFGPVRDSQGLALGDVDHDGKLDAVIGTRTKDLICLGDGLGGMSCSDMNDDSFSTHSVALRFLEQPSVRLGNNDGLGDAGIFQYYTVNSGWQTFFRVINTSDEAASVKVRFREAANSREVLDFTIFLSPYDVWAGWTDVDANGNGKPGIRTADTSCLYPLPDSNNTDEGWKTIAGNLKGADFQARAFTGIYSDNGPAVADRLAEGHIEMIGIAAHDPFSDFGLAVTHNQITGAPANCDQAATLFENATNGGEGFDLGNVLGFDGYVINVGHGYGGGYDPDVLVDFCVDSSLSWAANSSDTEPDLDTACHPAPGNGWGLKQKGLAGVQLISGKIDAVSSVFSRRSVINEWAASANPAAVVSDYYTQWLVTFPTKHYYVDLQTDLDLAPGQLPDDVSPTLVDPCPSCNDALWPFAEEFDWAGGKSCEEYTMRMYNREEADSSFTSPAPIYPVEMCWETNVIVFNSFYEDEGLDSNFVVSIPPQLLPVDAGGGTSERGWASMDFMGVSFDSDIRRQWYFDVPGLPVTGFLFSVYSTNNDATNHAAINAHKYTRYYMDCYECKPDD